MNITLTHGNSDSKFRQASSRIAALAAACTLGVAGFMGATGTFSSASTDGAPVTSAPRAIAHATVAQPRQHIILVDSAESKARLEAEMAMDSILAGEFEGRSNYVVVIKGTALEDSLTSASSAVQQLGNVTVTDTTVPPLQATNAVQPMFGPAADAEHAAQSLR